MQSTDPQLGQTLASGTVQVVRWFFRTNDEWARETYRDAEGLVKHKKLAANQDEPSEEGGRVDKAVINCLYEVTLVCGTNLAYNCRKVADQGRDLHDPKLARMPFSIFVAGLVKGEAISVTGTAKGIIDEIERSYRAYMAIKRTYTPTGSNIPPDALTLMAEALKIEGDNPEMAAYRFIKLHGDSFFPNVDPNTGRPLASPITANPFGMPMEAAGLEIVTGANAVVSAATPSGDAQGKGVNQIALQGAANVMSFLRDGLKLIYENHARNLAGRIWLTEKDVPVTGVVSDRDGTRRSVKPRPDLHEYEFHMEVNLGPSVEEKEQFKQNAFMATQGGPAAQLYYSDYLKACWLLEGNLKTAQQYVAVSIDRKRRQDEQKALNLQKANGDVQTQTGQAVAAAQQETDAKKHELTMAELQFARETSWGITDKQVAGQDRNSERMAQARVETAHISELGQAVRTDADNAHQMNHTALTAALAPEPAPVAA